MCCSRQTGKSTVAAALALKEAVLRPGSLTLLVSPSLRQSGELFRKVVDLNRRLGRPVPTASPRDSQLKMELANGSRIESLPATESTIRGFSAVGLLVIDEASRVEDGLLHSVLPMLAVSQGTLVALSTPWTTSGWFHGAWHDEAADWTRVRITADQCPRISKEFLAEQRRTMGSRAFACEFECMFTEAEGSLFTSGQLYGSLADDIKTLF